MTTTAHVAAITAVTAVWLAAGLLADALPDAADAGTLLRRTRLVSWLAGSGTVLLAASALLPGTAALLPAVPALVVVTVTGGRLRRLARGARAFTTAPLSPMPPALRAAAAHPLVGTPLQVTGLATVASLPLAAGLVTVPADTVVGGTVAAVAVAVVAIGARHALRHHRLAAGAVRVRALLGQRGRVVSW